MKTVALCPVTEDICIIKATKFLTHSHFWVFGLSFKLTGCVCLCVHDTLSTLHQKCAKMIATGEKMIILVWDRHKTFTPLFIESFIYVCPFALPFWEGVKDVCFSFDFDRYLCMYVPVTCTLKWPHSEGFLWSLNSLFTAYIMLTWGIYCMYPVYVCIHKNMVLLV